MTPDDHDRNDGTPPRDKLDSLLREWHQTNRTDATRGRDELMNRIQQRSGQAHPHTPAEAPRAGVIATIRSYIMNPYLSTAASMLLALMIGTFLLVPNPMPAVAQSDIIMVPDGGRLDAFDGDGTLVGPCPLEHTNVVADISGPFTRVTLKQRYDNPYKHKIEAVYTFPMSHRSAVDRMTMTVITPEGERLVIGEVLERNEARRIYEEAREAGYVASLLEQERPNIFTQSVANIEPGNKVVIEISYIETLASRDGVYTFDFPMVVGPRYIPGYPTGGSNVEPPMGCRPRDGVILLGPAEFTVEGGERGTAGIVGEAIGSAMPVSLGADMPFEPGDDATRFQARYADGSIEKGCIDNQAGIGFINNRYFCFEPVAPGAPFAQATDQVPDAAKITPMPVRPSQRAGHDISVTVNIDTGGPAFKDIRSKLHAIEVQDEGTGRRTIQLKDMNSIPNRDFVLEFSTADDTIQESILTHVDHREGITNGGYVSLILSPPARTDSMVIQPRELVFVLDTSGSMSGFPIQKAKEVIGKAIDGMRPDDTFNVITFAGNTHVLWPDPVPATAENRQKAQQFISSRQGGGGTEMMQAIRTALIQGQDAGLLSPDDLANLPADGRQVRVIAPYSNILASGDGFNLQLDNGSSIPMSLGVVLPTILQPEGVSLELKGAWKIVDGNRVLDVTTAGFADGDENDSMRIVMFLTDGYVGNDQAIIQAVRDNAHSTRVFSFGIGESTNRYLLENMAREGRGEVEYVLLNENGDEAVDRFVKRIATPVLTDITLEFSDGLKVDQIVPGSGRIPDLYDEKPLIIHARYDTPGSGQLVIRGRTGTGPYERAIDLILPEIHPENDVIETLWARGRVDQVLLPHLEAVQGGVLGAQVRQEVVDLGVGFQLMTPYTSFVAVEKSRITIDGKPVLVHVPIELPAGTSWEGFFGKDGTPENVLQAQVQLMGQTRAIKLAENKVRQHEDGDVDSLIRIIDREFGEGTSAPIHAAIKIREQEIQKLLEADRQEGATLDHRIGGTGSAVVESLGTPVQPSQSYASATTNTRYFMQPGQGGSYGSSRSQGSRTRGRTIAGGGAGGRLGFKGKGMPSAPASAAAPPPPPTAPVADMQVDSADTVKDAGTEKPETLVEYPLSARLIMCTIEPDAWESRGGNLLRMQIAPDGGIVVVDLAGTDRSRSLAEAADGLAKTLDGYTIHHDPDDPVQNVFRFRYRIDGDDIRYTSGYDISEMLPSVAVAEREDIEEHCRQTIIDSVFDQPGQVDREKISFCFFGRILVVSTNDPGVQSRVDRAVGDLLGHEHDPVRVDGKYSDTQLSTIARTLTPELLALCVGSIDADAPEKISVTVRVSKVDSPVADRLGKAGLSISGRSEVSRLVMGTIESTKLIDLSLVEGVRRIEPARISNTD